MCVCVCVYLSVCVGVLGEREWISTGVYVTPVMKTYISLPAQIVNKGWMVRDNYLTSFIFMVNLFVKPHMKTYLQYILRVWVRRECASAPQIMHILKF